MEKRGICGMCLGACGVIAKYDDSGKLISLRADDQSPYGSICPRGAAAPKAIYSDERIRYPMLRSGPRGSGQYRRVSWDEALEFIAEGFRQIGDKYSPNAIASYFGRGVLGTPINDYHRCADLKDNFLMHIGSPNDMNSNSICHLSANVMAPVTTMGLNSYSFSYDIGSSDLILVWGSNPAYGDGPKMPYRSITEARKRGAEVIVIDPRRRGMGEQCDRWIPIIPGTDGALVMAMAKLITDEMRYDTEFVSGFTAGFDEFKAYLDTLNLNALSECCGVPLDTIRYLTDRFCSTKKVALSAYTGWEYSLSGMQSFRALLTLFAVTGKLDTEGSLLFNRSAMPTDYPIEWPRSNPPVGAERFPLFAAVSGKGLLSRLPDAVLNDDPYPVRALMIMGGSPCITYPNSAVWKKVYEKLELLVVIDRFRTEDSRYADVILPAATLFENQYVSMGPGGIRLRERLVEPVGESRSDAFILQALAEKLGFGDIYPKTDDELCLKQLGGDKSRLEKLKKDGALPPVHKNREYQKHLSGHLRADGKPGFPTPSGKFEISSSIMRDLGFTPYPEFKDIRSLPGFDRSSYPFMLTIGARSPIRYGVTGPNIKELANMEPCPLCDIPRADAMRLGLADGDTVRISTPFGTENCVCRLSDMMPGTVSLPHGGGSAYMVPAWRDFNSNDLASLDCTDELSGFPTLKSLPCRIEKL